MDNGRDHRVASSIQTTNLADILERVLDKGIVIAGDITISLAEIELLKIKVRLLVASVDKAREMGIDWWQSDPALSSHTKKLESENADLKDRVERLEAHIATDLKQRLDRTEAERLRAAISNLKASLAEAHV